VWPEPLAAGKTGNRNIASWTYKALVGRCVHRHEIVKPLSTSYTSIRPDVQRAIQHSIKKTPHGRTGNIRALASGADVLSLGGGNPHVLNPVGFVCLHRNLASEAGLGGLIRARGRSVQPLLRERNRAHRKACCGEPGCSTWGTLRAIARTRKRRSDGLQNGEITKLFFIDIHAPGELRLIGVLKPERQRLVMENLWTGLKLIMQVWAKRVSRLSSCGLEILRRAKPSA
jgi:hypothetical protein